MAKRPVGVSKKNWASENCFNLGCLVEGMGGLTTEERGVCSFIFFVVISTIFVVVFNVTKSQFLSNFLNFD